jgi:peroxiredoxin Q/BCP
MLKIGDKAPDFEAQLVGGEKVRLSDLLKSKRVVLYFYLKDFTSGCTKEACYFRDTKGEFDRRDAVILGVSADSEESHRRFREQHGLNFGLIADEDNSVAQLFGVPRLGGRLFSQRATFVIDTDGVIRGVVHSETDMNVHVDQALEVLDRLPVRV